MLLPFNLCSFLFTWHNVDFMLLVYIHIVILILFFFCVCFVVVVVVFFFLTGYSKHIQNGGDISLRRAAVRR